MLNKEDSCTKHTYKHFTYTFNKQLMSLSLCWQLGSQENKRLLTSQSFPEGKNKQWWLQSDEHRIREESGDRKGRSTHFTPVLKSQS